MYMFRKLFTGRHLLIVSRRFSDEKLPTVAGVWMGKDSNQIIGVKSELKEDNPDWKATKGNGKSIYDCEDELWCTTENPLSDEWKEANKRED